MPNKATASVVLTADSVECPKPWSTDSVRISTEISSSTKSFQFGLNFIELRGRRLKLRSIRFCLVGRLLSALKFAFHCFPTRLLILELGLGGAELVC